ncbi:hypothetical protein G7Y89_g15509 [Cudoniella acicularis]|uniref:Secreted protein n=1 Tax=Cudoniella acicularis TaxID=354080 RepID=A0A8H4VKX0_9HELO|nr:hypothetical protein G7Y89_g15509 [Cudoniella acicularis]
MIAPLLVVLCGVGLDVLDADIVAEPIVVIPIAEPPDEIVDIIAEAVRADEAPGDAVPEIIVKPRVVVLMAELPEEIINVIGNAITDEGAPLFPVLDKVVCPIVMVPTAEPPEGMMERVGDVLIAEGVASESNKVVWPTVEVPIGKLPE